MKRFLDEVGLFLKKKFHNKSEAYYQYEIEKFRNFLNDRKGEVVNTEALSDVLSQLAIKQKNIWFIRDEKNLIKSDNKKWNDIFDTIAKNNLHYLVMTTPLYKEKKGEIVKLENMYIQFLKELNKKNIEPLTFEKFINLISEKDLVHLVTLNEAKCSFLSLLIDTGRTDLMEIAMNRFGSSAIFDLSMDLYKHQNSYVFKEKQNFIGYIIDCMFSLPLCPERPKDIKKKDNLKKMKNFFFEHIEKYVAKNDKEQSILDEQLNKCISIINFMTTEQLEKVMNANLIKENMVLKCINFLIDKIKDGEHEKETELVYKLLAIKNVNFFDLYQVKMINPIIEQIDFITNTNIFSDDKIAKSIMSFYFSFNSFDKDLYEFYIDRLDKENYSDKEKEDILLLSLDVLNLTINTNIFADIMKNGVLEDIYSRIMKKHEFKERLNTLAFKNIRKLAYHDMFLIVLQKLNFNPYEEVEYKGVKTTFKDSLEKPYVDNLDKIFIIRKAALEKSAILSKIEAIIPDEKSNTKRRRI